MAAVVRYAEWLYWRSARTPQIWARASGHRATGQSWTDWRDQPAFHYYLLALRMQAMVATPSGMLVGGWRSDVGKGSSRNVVYD